MLLACSDDTAGDGQPDQKVVPGPDAAGSDMTPKTDGVAKKDGPAAGDAGKKHHPAGWKSSKVHGLDAKHQKQKCYSCHGQDLLGKGKSPSCDKCHKKGWRTNCVYCHGGTKNQTGAPPRDIDNTVTVSQISFPPHTTHVTTTIAKPFGCEQCHIKPTNVTSKNHLFDPKPGKAEIDFSGGLAAGAAYTGTCTNLYCHGNGQGKNGTASPKDGKKTCSSCHAYVNSSAADLGKMSGRHLKHLVTKKITCSECHSSVDATGKIIKPTWHVNGTVETPKNYNPTKKTCNGTCHTKVHLASKW